LTPGAQRTAREIAEVVIDQKSRRISVEGHTDSLGTAAYNERLSEARARAVANTLVNSGIPRNRVDSRGFGEGRPIATNSSPEGRQRNRRVEVILENR
jgi:OOP family OmpA-OmpF porin